MKAIEIKTKREVYVMEIRDNNHKVIKYVSDNQSFYPEELEIIKTETDYE